MLEPTMWHGHVGKPVENGIELDAKPSWEGAISDVVLPGLTRSSSIVEEAISKIRDETDYQDRIRGEDVE